jgi:hypothetical protein
MQCVTIRKSVIEALSKGKWKAATETNYFFYRALFKYKLIKLTHYTHALTHHTYQAT